LEELVENGRRMPFGGKVSVDREAFLNIIDQMRITIPQDLRRYKEFEAEKDRYIAQAQEEARVILEQAREDAARLLDEQSIKQQAEVDARRIAERARREADEVRSGSDAYALASLQELDRQVQRLARTIQNGLSELAGTQGENELSQANAADAGPAYAAEAGVTEPSQSGSA
jgi:vacuolar-type H+-ATPase subunit H